MRAAVFAGVLLAILWPAAVLEAAEGSGKLVCRGERFDVMFHPADGSLRLVSQLDVTRAQALRILPCLSDGTAADRGVSCRVTKEAEATTLAWECKAGAKPVGGAVSIDGKGTITIRPGPGMGGVAVLLDIEYVVLPSRWVASTEYRPERYPPSATLHIPPENLLMGLCAGGNRVVVLAWPTGRQTVTVTRNDETGARAGFRRMRVMLGGRELHVGVFDAPGIWHKVVLDGLTPDNDIPLDWKPPHAGRWVTQIAEAGTPLVYEFRKGRRKGWRPSPVGWYIYPTWFDKGTPFIHLSEKIPPKGTALIYSVDEQGFKFLADVLPPGDQAALVELGRPRSIWDFTPEGPSFVWHTSCAGAARMKETILEVGAQQREWQLVANHADDRRRKNTGSERRNARYRDFIADMKERMREWTLKEKDHPDAAAFLEEMGKHLEELERWYRQTMKDRSPEEHIARNRELAERIEELVRVPGNERLPELRWLIGEMNYFMGLLEHFGKDCGAAVRVWFQEAARACADHPAGVAYAIRIRQAIRELLEYRCGYETPVRPRRDLRRKRR